MKLETWALLAEVVSGFAIVVTLVFLIFEVRDNTAVTRAMVYSDSIDSLNAAREFVISSPENARIWAGYVEGDTTHFEGLDRVRLSLMVDNLFGVYEKAYFANQYGVMGVAEWGRFLGQVCRGYRRLLLDPELTRQVGNVLTEEFMEFMAASCEG